jgi:hypothetical protein
LCPGFSDFSLALLRERKLIEAEFRFKRLGLVPGVEGNPSPRPHSISRGDRSAHGHDPNKQARLPGPHQLPQPSSKGIVRPRSSAAAGQVLPASLGGLDGYLVAPLLVATLPVFPRAMRGHQLVVGVNLAVDGDNGQPGVIRTGLLRPEHPSHHDSPNDRRVTHHGHHLQNSEVFSAAYLAMRTTSDGLFVTALVTSFRLDSPSITVPGPRKPGRLSGYPPSSRTALRAANWILPPQGRQTTILVALDIPLCAELLAHRKAA